MQKFVAAILLSLLIFSNTAAAQFSDIEQDSLTFMYRHGIIEGYPDGTFKPSDPINRAELIKIIMSAENITPDTMDEECFPDLVKGEWYTPYVCTAKENGWISGYPDGTYKPSNFINKAEAFKIITNILDLNRYDYLEYDLNHQFSDVPQDEWYAGHVNTLSELYYLNWTDSIYPSAEISRDEVAEILFRNLLTKKLYEPRKAESLNAASLSIPGVEKISAAESLAIAARDFFRIANVIENTTHQDALDYQEEGITALYEQNKLIIESNDYEIDPESWNLHSVMEQNGYIYAVLNVIDPERELQTYTRGSYYTFAVIKFDSSNLQIKAYDFFTMYIDRPGLILAIAEISDENTVDIYMLSSDPSPYAELTDYDKKSFHLRDLKEIPE